MGWGWPPCSQQALSRAPRLGPASPRHRAGTRPPFARRLGPEGPPARPVPRETGDGKDRLPLRREAPQDGERGLPRPLQDGGWRPGGAAGGDGGRSVGPELHRDPRPGSPRAAAAAASRALCEGVPGGRAPGNRLCSAPGGNAAGGPPPGAGRPPNAEPGRRDGAGAVSGWGRGPRGR